MPLTTNYSYHEPNMPISTKSTWLEALFNFLQLRIENFWKATVAKGLREVVFHCDDWEGELLDRSDEAKELRFFGLAELPSLPANEAPTIDWWQKWKAGGGFILD